MFSLDEDEDFSVLVSSLNRVAYGINIIAVILISSTAVNRVCSSYSFYYESAAATTASTTAVVH